LSLFLFLPSFLSPSFCILISNQRNNMISHFIKNRVDKVF
jgi:hypothetical protein